MIQAWRLDDGRQTLVLAAREAGLPSVVYWAAPLPAGEDPPGLAQAAVIDRTSGTVDDIPDLSICPETRHGFTGHPGLAVRDGAGRPLTPRFRLVGADASDGACLSIAARDDHAGLTYRATLRFDPVTGVLVAAASLQADAPIWLDWLAAPVLPGPQAATELVDFSGRWCGEFQPNHVPWSPGARLREARAGRTSHEHFPGLLAPLSGAGNTTGEAYLFHYGWSGGHRMVAEELPDGRRQIQFGHAWGSERASGTWFETATLYAAYSDAGINGCAVALQRQVRDRILGWTAPVRLVHYNCWEAVYFDHELETLRTIATRAAALGAERFVLDDGWFGRRDDDTTSLGDWRVDPRKFPDGLGPLIEHVQAQGMGFGLWVEPEMVNPDSDLYRTHPDWVQGPPDQPLARRQLVLDMAKPEVRDHLYEALAALLRAHPITYLKWDHNRPLPLADAAQARGAYALIDRLRAAFPQTEIESCASGGGRIDYGVLARTQRVWLSDSNDALERARMQHEAALFLPAAVTGSHVGPRVCHTSGRILDIRFRAWTAAQRHLGFEMDPRDLSEDETVVLSQVTAWWKANRDWLLRADILRLDSADPAVLGEMRCAVDGVRFAAFVTKLDSGVPTVPRPIRLTGLAPERRYRVGLANRVDLHTRSRGPVALKDGPLEASGTALMRQGVTLPWHEPNSVWVLEGERL